MKPKIIINKNKLVLTATLEKNDLYKVDEKDNRFNLSIFKKPQWVKGVTSYCEDGKHILMLDYDNVCRWIVEQELTELSKAYGAFLLFSTKEEKKDGETIGNYHGVCLSKFVPNQIVDIQRVTSCDYSYITMPLRTRYRSWVLRQSDKNGSGRPKLVTIIGAKTQQVFPGTLFEVSTAHLQYFEKLYGPLHVRYDRQDGLTKLFINQYETGV